MNTRDLKILEFLTEVRIATTKQIQNIFFKGLHHSISYRRLQYLVDNKLVKRSYFHVNNKNVYVYYLDKKPSKRNIEHDLLITEFYIQLINCGFNILEFERTPIIANIVPDAIIKFSRPNHQEKKEIFLEVQLSPHNCTKKYFNIKSKVEKDIPNTLYIITNQQMKYTDLRDLKVVIDTPDFKKLGFYFS